MDLDLWLQQLPYGYMDAAIRTIVTRAAANADFLRNTGTEEIEAFVEEAHVLRQALLLGYWQMVPRREKVTSTISSRQLLFSGPIPLYNAHKYVLNVVFLKEVDTDPRYASFIEAQRTAQRKEERARHAPKRHGFTAEELSIDKPKALRREETNLEEDNMDEEAKVPKGKKDKEGEAAHPIVRPSRILITSHLMKRKGQTLDFGPQLDVFIDPGNTLRIVLTHAVLRKLPPEARTIFVNTSEDPRIAAIKNLVDESMISTVEQVTKVEEPKKRKKKKLVEGEKSALELESKKGSKRNQSTS